MFGVKRGGKVPPSVCRGSRLASDACVATLARPTGVGRLAGRPVPLGRRSLRTAFAADETSHFSSCAEVFSDELA